MTQREIDAQELYNYLESLKKKQENQTFSDFNQWRVTIKNKKGVYFIIDPHEKSRFSSMGRVVRVGTHATSTKKEQKSTLAKRLKNHVGNKDGSGNHNTSIFRKLVGVAIYNQQLQKYVNLDIENWKNNKKGKKNLSRYVRELELEVTKFMKSMIVLYVYAETPQDRSSIERNSIALLSGWHGNMGEIYGDCFTKIKDEYLTKCQKSGLWVKDFVCDKEYSTDFFK